MHYIQHQQNRLPIRIQPKKLRSAANFVWQVLPAKHFFASKKSCLRCILIHKNTTVIRNVHDNACNTVDKKWVNCCVLNHLYFWGGSATKQIAKNPRKCCLRRVANITFWKLCSWRRQKKENPFFARFFETVLCVVKITELIVELIRGQTFSEVVCFTSMIYWLLSIASQISDLTSPW